MARASRQPFVKGVELRGIKMEEMTTKWLALHIACLVICTVLFVTGAVGLAVLIDVDRTSWLGRTVFSNYYWMFAMKFNYATAAFINGGLLGIILCALKLYGHRSAVKAESQAEKKKKVEGKKAR